MTPVSQQPSNGPNSADLNVNLTPTQLTLLDQLAERGARSGRAGREFRLFSILGLPDDLHFGERELGLFTFAAELGYREGKAVRQ